MAVVSFSVGIWCSTNECLANVTVSFHKSTRKKTLLKQFLALVHQANGRKLLPMIWGMTVCIIGQRNCTIDASNVKSLANAWLMSQRSEKGSQFLFIRVLAKKYYSNNSSHLHIQKKEELLPMTYWHSNSNDILARGTAMQTCNWCKQCVTKTYMFCN